MILAPETPVIVRMETLRRAAIYSFKDSRLAYELLAKIMARTLDAQPGSKAEAMAWFDAGYLVETFRQASFESKQNPATGLDGYAWTVRAIVLNGGNPEMEYAAALMRFDKSWPNEHFRKALAASREGSLLSRNMARHRR
jgi:hypothetical protein